MKLLIDIGNSRVKCVSLTGQKLPEQKLSLAKVVLNDKFTLAWLEQHYSTITKVIIASVNQAELTNIVTTWASKYDIDCIVVKAESERFGVKSVYKQVDSFGVDRWLALIGAAQRYKQKSVLILDAGTATTLDILTSTGQHLGGWILPGVNLMFTSLLKHTVKVHAQK